MGMKILTFLKDFFIRILTRVDTLALREIFNFPSWAKRVVRDHSSSAVVYGFDSRLVHHVLFDSVSVKSIMILLTRGGLDIMSNQNREKSPQGGFFFFS